MLGPSHVAADRGCDSLAGLCVIECYCAAIQFPGTPLHAINQSGQVSLQSLSWPQLFQLIFFLLLLIAFSLCLSFMEKHRIVVLQLKSELSMPLPDYSGRFREIVVLNDTVVRH